MTTAFRTASDSMTSLPSLLAVWNIRPSSSASLAVSNWSVMTTVTRPTAGAGEAAATKAAPAEAAATLAAATAAIATREGAATAALAAALAAATATQVPHLELNVGRIAEHLD